MDFQFKLWMIMAIVTVLKGVGLVDNNEVKTLCQSYLIEMEDTLERYFTQNHLADFLESYEDNLLFYSCLNNNRVEQVESLYMTDPDIDGFDFFFPIRLSNDKWVEIYGMASLVRGTCSVLSSLTRSVKKCSLNDFIFEY